MKNYKLHISEGFNDFYGKEIILKKEIEERIFKIFNSHGYDLIKTSPLEYIDVYSTNGVQKPDLYNLINRQGEVLSLCNDMTSSIARFVCSNNNLNKHMKYCYCADIFRYPKQYQGKNHMFTQAGIELIGEGGLLADLEVIQLAYKCLRACNIDKFMIHLGSNEFLNNLFDDFNISFDVKNKIYNAIENKDYVELKNTLDNNLDKNENELIMSLMLRGGHLNYLKGLMNKLEGLKSYNSLKYLEKLYNYLDDLGINNILFDFSIFSYAKYYTGVIFQIFVDNTSKAIIEGGRCDNLFKEFGKDLADIGFGLDISLLARYVIDNSLIEINNKKYLAYYNDENYLIVNKICESIRNDELIVNLLPFLSYDEAYKYALDNDYNGIIKIENDAYLVMEVRK